MPTNPLQPAAPQADPLSAFDPYIDEAAKAYQVDRDLIRAVIQHESGGNPKATSGVGAQGLMQLMPGTAKELGVTDPFDPRQNIMAGARYLKRNLNMFHGDVDKTIAGYNAGPGAVQQYNGIPPYAETQNYVKNVKGTWEQFKAARPTTPATPVTSKPPALGGVGASTVPATNPAQLPQTTPSMPPPSELPDISVAKGIFKSPEMTEAAKSFKDALSGQMIQAAMGMDTFTNVMSSPYSFLLGQSDETVARVMFSKIYESAKDHPVVSKVMTPAVIREMSIYLNDQKLAMAGRPPVTSPDRRKWQQETLLPYLNSLSENGLGFAVRSGMAMAMELTNDQPNYVNAFAGLTGAQASIMNAQTNQKQQDFIQTKYWDTDRNQALASTDLTKAQTQLTQFNADRQSLLNSFIPQDKRLEAAQSKSAVTLQSAQAKQMLGSLRLSFQNDKDQKVMDSLNMQQTGIANLHKRRDDLQKTMDQYLKANPMAATYKDPQTGQPDQQLTQWRAELSAIDLSIKNETQLFTDLKAKYQQQGFAGPDAEAAFASPYLATATQIAASGGSADITSVYNAARSKNDHTDAGNIMFQNFVPPVAMKWDPKMNTFVSDSEVQPGETLPVAVSQMLYHSMITDPAKLAAVRAGIPMKPQEWLSFCNKVNKQFPSANVGLYHYRHYVSMLNYVKQTDHMLNLFRRAQQTGIVDENTDMSDRVTTNDAAIDAPQVDYEKYRLGGAANPLPQPGRRKGRK